MIRVNGKELCVSKFPDGTPLIHLDASDICVANILWTFESMEELVTLSFVTKHLQSTRGIREVNLFMPYIPNARQDRVKRDDDVFTLKYFAWMINELGFDRVHVLDPHSNVSAALFDNLTVHNPVTLINDAFADVASMHGYEKPTFFFPDDGAMKRYSELVPSPCWCCFGIKERDWDTGKILGLSVHGDEALIRGRNILIVDDICSRGGTFLHSARKLKEMGADKIYLCVTHCENTILDGELLDGDLVEKVYTTDSTFTGEHDKIVVSKAFYL